jgi:hypothetical protein
MPGILNFVARQETPCLQRTNQIQQRHAGIYQRQNFHGTLPSVDKIVSSSPAEVIAGVARKATVHRHQASVASTHFLQRHERLRSGSGSRASATGSTVTSSHQHGVSNVPANAGAHSFGASHSGHEVFRSGSIRDYLNLVCR